MELNKAQSFWLHRGLLLSIEYLCCCSALHIHGGVETLQFIDLTTSQSSGKYRQAVCEFFYVVIYLAPSI